MALPGYQPFYLDDVDQLRSEIARLGLDLAVEEDPASLGDPVRVGERCAPSRFCALPVEGRDAEPGGSPGPLTLRRYRRLAEGGFGLIWLEGAAVAPGVRSHPAQLCLHEANLDAYADWVSGLKQAARDALGREPMLILQLVHSGSARRRPGVEEDPPLLSDDELEGIPETFAHAAALAVQAGFDGMDIRAGPADLFGDLLSAFTRPGSFGGDFEGRTRLLLETVAEIRRRVPEGLLATRLNAFHAVSHPHGFGVDRHDYRRPDLDEPVRLVRKLQAEGVSLFGITAASPNLRGPLDERARSPLGDADPPDEHPLTVLARHIDLARELRAGSAAEDVAQASSLCPTQGPKSREDTGWKPVLRAVGDPSPRAAQEEPCPIAPSIAIVGCGYTWLRRFLPQVAAGAVGEGAIDFVGMGRSALACPDAPLRVLRHGSLEPGRCCMVCFACSQLDRDGGPVGCVIRDHDVYGPVYRNRRRSDPGRLEEEARRCHLCEAAPCVAASPTRTDIPGFLQAFARDDMAGAYEVIRRRDPLPEMTSNLSPSWLESEGACIETILNGRPVPILDIQHAVACLAREQGRTGIRLSGHGGGRRVAVVGGGPAGLAGAIRLLELGYSVDLLEKTQRLGGIPERVIPAERFPGAAPEVETILQPALDAGRLKVRHGEELGRSVALDELRAAFDAVLLAAGLWQEPSLGRADGAVGALAFLERVKEDGWPSVPRRVAILAGGDAAMDAAVTAKALGADEVYVVFGGSRAEMHWHLPDAWFATPGVHALMLCRPMGYELDEEGRLAGVRVCRMEPGARDVAQASCLCPSQGRESPGDTGRMPVARVVGANPPRLPQREACRAPTPVPDSESVLEVGLAIEAMGLEIDEGLRGGLEGVQFGERGLVSVSEDRPYFTGVDRVFVAGALINGAASVARCVAEGVAAAEEIDRCLS